MNPQSGIPKAEIAAVAVRIEEAHGAGRARLDGGAARIAADAEAAVGGAVIAAILGENLGPAGEHRARMNAWSSASLPLLTKKHWLNRPA